MLKQKMTIPRGNSRRELVYNVYYLLLSVLYYHRRMEFYV